MDKLFDAVAEPLSNGEAINEWVEGKTNGLVTDLVAPGPVDAAVVLVNAIHFKGSWSKAFDPKMTRRGTFYTPDGAITVQVREDVVRGDKITADHPHPNILPSKCRLLLI